jgi:hypothetical protein
MTIAQGYVYCLCLSAALLGVALPMIFLGVTRRGEAANWDDGAARLLVGIGIALVVTLAVVWAIGLSDKIR